MERDQSEEGAVVFIFRDDHCGSCGVGIGVCVWLLCSYYYLGRVTSFDFLVAARYFVVVLIFAIDYDDGEVGVEESEGSVFEGAGGVALSVNVAYFFDF